MKKSVFVAVIVGLSLLTTFALVNITATFIIPALYPSEPIENPLFPRSLIEPPQDPFSLNSFLAAFYNSAPYIAPVAWGIFAAMLAWKGGLKSIWIKRGYDYDTFKLLSKMRGSETKVQILQRLSVPKTRLQLAKELDMDWKTIDGHVNMLINNSFVKEFVHVGTYKYLIISEKGKEVLELLDSSESSRTEYN